MATHKDCTILQQHWVACVLQLTLRIVTAFVPLALSSRCLATNWGQAQSVV